MSVRKYGHVMRFSEEIVADHDGFHQRGHIEYEPLTEEDRAAHKRAQEALAELESNPWVFRDYEDYKIEPLEPRGKFVPEETTEEWLARWRAWRASQ